MMSPVAERTLVGGTTHAYMRIFDHSQQMRSHEIEWSTQHIEERRSLSTTTLRVSIGICNERDRRASSMRRPRRSSRSVTCHSTEGSSFLPLCLACFSQTIDVCQHVFRTVVKDAVSDTQVLSCACLVPGGIKLSLLHCHACIAQQPVCDRSTAVLRQCS